MTTQTQAATLVIDALSKTFRTGDTDIRAVNGASAAIGNGEIVAIVGPSGSGKTTLLSMMGCLLTPTSGRVLVLGEDVYELGQGQRSAFRLQHLGFVFQAFNLLPALDAQENIEIALNLAGIHGREARVRAGQLLELLQLEKRARQRPGNLSGGEQQRLAIARALANRPEVILADEPTASLDSQAGQRVMELLRLAIREGEARSLVVVTHDVRILDFANRVLFMEDGQLGSPVQPGEPGTIHR
ncbi:MAG: ABC transporter ATP-binding protein [Dehalococcoidia bacterium]